MDKLPFPIDNEDVVLDPGEIIHARDGRYGIGAILCMFVGGTSEILLVRKAARVDYEFSGLWTCPGGMVRAAQDSTSLEACIRNSLSLRVRMETGIVVEPNDCEPLSCFDKPLVSSYHAKGRRRYTVVLPYKVVLESPLSVSPEDSSICDAKWVEPPFCWNEIAPVNRVLLARIYWSKMCESDKDPARKALYSAIEDLRVWASCVGLSAIETDWIDSPPNESCP